MGFPRLPPRRDSHEASAWRGRGKHNADGSVCQLTQPDMFHFKPISFKNKSSDDGAGDSLQETLTRLVKKKKDREKIRRIIEDSGPQILADCDLLRLLQLSTKYSNRDLLLFILDSKSEINVEEPDMTPLIDAAIDDDYVVAKRLQHESTEAIVLQLYGKRKPEEHPRYCADEEIKSIAKRWSRSVVASRVVSKLVERRLAIDRIGRLLLELDCSIEEVVGFGNPELTEAYLEAKRPEELTDLSWRVFPALAKNVDVRHLEVFLNYNRSVERQWKMAKELFSVLMRNIRKLHETEAGRIFVKCLLQYEFFDDQALQHLEDTMTNAGKETLEIFLEYGFRQVMKSRSGRDMLVSAFGNRNPGVFEFLKSVDIDVDARGSYDCTPLHAAVEINAREPVQWLLDAGANPNLLNEFGYTPLNCCFDIEGISDAECARLLLIGGANPLINYEEVSKDWRGFFRLRGDDWREVEYRNVIKDLLALLAVQQALGMSVERPIEDCKYLMREEFESEFYEKCLQQLECLKDQEIDEFGGRNFTMFNLVSGRVEERFARSISKNERIVIAKFMGEYESELIPFYYDVLKNRIEIVDRVMMYSDTVRSVLSECMRIADSNHLVIHKILNLLTFKDLLIST